MVSLSELAEALPPLLVIDVNDVCASRCLHCSYGQLREERLLPLERVLEALEEAHQYGCRVLTVAAREPFHPGARERTRAVLEQAARLGFDSVAAITSARFLDAGHDFLARHGLRLDSLDVSVDGQGALHDRIRGVAEWSFVEERLHREAYRDITDNLCCSVTLQRDNVDAVIPLLDWLAEGERVDGVLIAAVSSVGHARRESALQPGRFTTFLHALEAWHRRCRPDDMEVALELTPDSVPEICELVESGVLRPEQVRLTDQGMPLLELESGLRIRVMAGLFSLGRVLRIGAGGDARLAYQNLGESYQVDLRKESLGQYLRRMLDEGMIYRPVIEAAERNQAALDCPAWPFHLDHCPQIK